MSDDTNLVEAIFLEAIARPKEDLDDFLAERCNADEGLKQQVLELLAAHNHTGSFFVDKQPAWQCTTQDSEVTQQVGQQIADYILREQIGEGGMGVVYVAEQHKPIRRKVALKVIKPGMDSKAVVARFEAERNALALMNHPNIAKVLEAGTTTTGRPYFVMELVNGCPITQYCDEQKLNINERLNLFRDVCGAIQHAHQKGIIHRDLKPSNVLVTELDGKPTAKVIDFGVAKALNQSLTDRSIYTAFQTIIGTPLYMSPEQATFSAVDVDTRSDVYALGVLLYELLTGTTPFTNEDFKQAAQDEVFRLIRESEPPRPSNRISSLGDTATRVSQLRRTQPDQLGRAVRGDLDWIVMKAISKERGRRYKSADDLSEDIRKHLHNLPVEARPPSFGYRLSRFCRRNRTSVAATCMVLIVTLGLSIVAGRALWRETQLATKYREQLYQKLLLKTMSGAASLEDEIRQAERDGLGDEQLQILRSLAAMYSGTPDEAIKLLEPVARQSGSIPVNSLLAMAYYQSGRLREGVEQRDVASSLAAKARLSNEDRLFLAYCALGVDRDGVGHIDRYLDEEKPPSPLGFAVSADVRSWDLGYGDDANTRTQTALEHIAVARKFFGSTAYILQVELKLNMEAYRTAIASGDQAAPYLARAKAAEAGLAKSFPDYVWGRFMRGSLWYGLRDYEKAAEVWNIESNDWILSCRGLALVRANRDHEARKVAEQIRSPDYRLLLFPELRRDDDGRRLAREAYYDVVGKAEHDATYRLSHVLVAGLFVGVPDADIRATARRWLAMSEDDETKAWANWERSCLSFLARVSSPSELREEAGDIVAFHDSAQFFVGAMELIQGDPEVAMSELKKGFDPKWDGTFLGSMWCACLVDQLHAEMRQDSNDRNEQVRDD